MDVATFLQAAGEHLQKLRKIDVSEQEVGRGRHFTPPRSGRERFKVLEGSKAASGHRAWGINEGRGCRDPDIQVPPGPVASADFPNVRNLVYTEECNHLSASTSSFCMPRVVLAVFRLQDGDGACSLSARTPPFGSSLAPLGLLRPALAAPRFMLPHHSPRIANCSWRALPGKRSHHFAPAPLPFVGVLPSQCWRRRLW